MKKMFTFLMVSFFVLSFYQVVSAQETLARWNFEGVSFSSTAATSPSLTAGSFEADSGALVTGSAFTGLHASSSTVWSDPAGNGSINSMSSNNWGVGDYYQFSFSTIGYNDIKINWDQIASSTGPAYFKIQYSTDGSTFTDDSNGAYSIPHTYSGGNFSWSSSTRNDTTSFSLDLSSITGLNNQPIVYIRLVDTSAVSYGGATVATTGTNRVDNFRVTGTTVAVIPTLSVVPSTLSGFTYVEGAGPSTSQSYTLSGSNLTPADSVITVAGSTNYEVSSDDVTFSDTLKIDYTGGALLDTLIYVRLKAALTTGDYNGEIITNTGGGATQQDVTVDGSVTSIPSLLGDYYIGAPGTGPNGNDPQFATLRDAFEIINNSPFSGNCTFYITSDIEETFTPVTGYGLGLAANPDPYTITFKPYTGVQPVITLDYPTDGTSGPSGALIVGIPMENNIAWNDLRVTKNIVIDGSNTVDGTTRDLTIQSALTAQRNAFPLTIVGDVSNMVIKNTNIYYKAQGVSTSGNLFVSAVQLRSRNNLGVDFVPHDILFENNHISANFDGVVQSAQGYGTYQSGTPVPAALPYNITLKNNVIEGKRRAIALYLAGSHNIVGNDIILNQNIAANTTNEAIYAVNVLAGSEVNIFGNKIAKVSSMTNAASSGNTAISIETNGTYNVVNNMIYGFELTAANPVAYVRGIKNSSATATLNSAFNSIYMTDLEDVGTGSVAYAGYFLSDGTNNVGNNIVYSAEKDFPSYCIYRSGALGTLMSNYNDFYPATDSAKVGYFNTAATPTLVDWQTASTQDSNSISKEVFFVSDTDLHLTGSSDGDLDLAGTPITGITTDIDGDTRGLYPYMGADEASISLVPWVTIAKAREDLNADGIPDKLGETLMIRGVVISPNFQTSNHSYYIWDGTAGIAEILFGTTSPALSLGDSVEMVGKIDLYRGLTEFSLSASTDLTVLGSGSALPNPLELTLAQYMANPEMYEGTLLKFSSLNKVSTATWPAAGSSSTLKFTDGVDTVDFRIDSDTNIDGSTEPTWPANIVGIGSQFSSSTTSYFDGYQILPRYITDFTSVASSVENENTVVTEFALAQNYPNPFNPTTRINYSVPTESKVTIAIYSITGELVAELVNEYKTPGNYSVNFDGSKLASGMYIYRMMAGNFVKTNKMMLLK